MQSDRGDAIALPPGMDRSASHVEWQQALAAYVEPLAVGRRVAVFGDASAALGAQLAELGARSVFVWDPDADRARREADLAPHGVIVRPLFSGADAGPQRGAFDLAIVADLTLFDDVDTVLARVRRLVGDDGAALVAVPNRDGDPDKLDYYELFDRVARQFEHVTMIAQLPFRGVALAELGGEEGDPTAVTVDMQLGDRDRAPDAFVALASQGGVLLDPYAIIELPTTASDGGVVDEAMRVALEEARLRIPLLEASLQAMHERAARAEHAQGLLAEREAQVASLIEQLERSQAGLEVGRLASSELEAVLLRAERAEALLERAQAGLDAGRLVSAKLGDVALRAERAEALLEQARAGLDAGRLVSAKLGDVALRAERAEALLEQARAGLDAGRLVSAKLGDVVLQAERAEAALERAQAELEAARVESSKLEDVALGGERAQKAVAVLESELARVHDAHAVELARYEEALRDRGRTTRALEAEVARRDRMVEDLVGALQESAVAVEPAASQGEGVGGVAPQGGLERALPTAEDLAAAPERDSLAEENIHLRGRLDALALDLARREGDAQAMAWTIVELERRLETATVPSVAEVAPAQPVIADAADRLGAALDEVDVLRQALAQEHDARIRAESGDALAQALAEVQRQAALLDELRESVTLEGFRPTAPAEPRDT